MLGKCLSSVGVRHVADTDTLFTLKCLCFIEMMMMMMINVMEKEASKVVETHD